MLGSIDGEVGLTLRELIIQLLCLTFLQPVRNISAVYCVRINITFFSEAIIINPLSPHDALNHHFTSLKTDFIFL